MTRHFQTQDAAEARAQAPVPLMVGLTGPSSSGKTYTGLRIATGIQLLYGGDIFVVDTEQRRSLHYADKFKFKHVDFQAPYASGDYLEALRYCKKQGAGVVMIDSCSHEHDGPGGMLEQHETELTRMAGNDFGKRDRMSMLAWAKPKAARRQLITAITTELAMPVIFCFRAKTGTKPAPKGSDSRDPIEMGFTSIGADEWLFEMAVNMLFLPGADGVPTWESSKPGERLAIKCPTQFRWMRDLNGPITEDVGVRLAKWARDGVSAPHQPKTPARTAEAARPISEAATDIPGEIADFADALEIEIEAARDSVKLGTHINEQMKTAEWGALRDAAPERAKALKALAVKRIGELKAAA